MGELCTVLDELIKNKDLQEFGIFASRNCFGGLLSGKKRVIIVPPASEQKKLFNLTGEKAIDALKQLIIPRPGKSVSLKELAKKGEMVAVNGTAVYSVSESKVSDAKIVKTIESRNGLIIVVDKMPSSSGTRDVKKSEGGKKKMMGGKKKTVKKIVDENSDEDEKMTGGKKKKAAMSRPGVKKRIGKKKRVMRGGNGYSLDITLNDNDLRSKVITIYKNRFGSGGYSYPWYYYLYGNVLSYLSATERDAYLKYYWLIKMDPYSSVGGFLTPFLKKSYQYYPLSDGVIKNWSRSSWWCNPSIRTGFSYAVYGGMQHDAMILGGDGEGVTTITISSYQDSLSRAYSELIMWLKTKGQSCNKFEKMAKVKEFFKRASGEHGSYGIYKELPESERWKALYYYALYDYICSRRTEFSVGDKTLREIVDRVFSNIDGVFDKSVEVLNDEGIKKFAESVGKIILEKPDVKKKVLANEKPAANEFGNVSQIFMDHYKKQAPASATNPAAVPGTATPGIIGSVTNAVSSLFSSSTPATTTAAPVVPPTTSAAPAVPPATSAAPPPPPASSSVWQTVSSYLPGTRPGTGGAMVQIPYSSGTVNADHAWGQYHGGKKKKSSHKKKKSTKKPMVGGKKKKTSHKKSSPGPVGAKRPGTKKKKTSHKKKSKKN
jgi:hypothetical protein